MAWLGGLAVGALLAALFLVFAHRIGALASFGREPLDNRRFLALCAGAFVPGAGCLGSIGLAASPWLLANPDALAAAMAGVAVAGRQALLALQAAAKPPEA